MLRLLGLNLLEVLKAVLPLVGTVCVLQVAFVHAPGALFLQFLAGSLLAIVGMVLLFAGIDLGLLPMGRYIGAELPKKGSLWLIAAVAFALGFATTAAEPDVLVLVGQFEAAAEGAVAAQTLVYIIAAGVGLFTALGMLRVVAGIPFAFLLAAVHTAMIVLTFVAPTQFIPLAYDAGSVATGVLTTPVVLAFAIGFSAVLARRSAMADGFGLLGLASVGPIIAVLVLGIVLR